MEKLSLARTQLFYIRLMIMMLFMLLETTGGGGVVIYVNKKLNGRLCETKSLMVDDVLECVTVECEINRNKTAFVSCVYRCPGSDIVSF